MTSQRGETFFQDERAVLTFLRETGVGRMAALEEVLAGENGEEGEPGPPEKCSLPLSYLCSVYISFVSFVFFFLARLLRRLPGWRGSPTMTTGDRVGPEGNHIK